MDYLSYMFDGRLHRNYKEFISLIENTENNGFLVNCLRVLEQIVKCFV